MDERSQETLHRVEQNDATLTTLMIGTILTRANGGEEEVGAFSSRHGGEFSQLGAFIGQNTNLTMLDRIGSIRGRSFRCYNNQRVL